MNHHNQSANLFSTDVPAMPRAQAAATEPIAIIGMGCRFPGIHGPDEYWNVLTQGIDVISEVPRGRWDIQALYHPDASRAGKIASRFGGFLNHLEEFDAAFFSISPREAPHVDPRQRVMLEIAWEALEDAAIPPTSLAGSKTGVFAATLTSDYDQILSRDIRLFQVYSGTGTANSIIANRISYFLDLHGPSITLDTACSGSLVAVDLACKSLRAGESDIALAGGIAINLLPNGDVFFSRAGSLSPDGRCHTFDSNANGIVRSEGAGIVVLKRLSDALASGDRIYAVVRGSAVNHDGRSNGITSPNGEAQEAVIREAYRQAGVSPGAVQYVEAHGTGTPVGDPIEVKALISVLETDRPAGFACVLGSAKSNIGHTESAAGIAGLIKVALALKHRTIPLNLHLRELNPLIPASSFPVTVYQQVGAWPVPSAPLIAGISSFGFGGTNAHVVLEEAHAPEISHAAARSAWLLPLSARSPEALKSMAAAFEDFLEDRGAGVELGDICYTASVGRSHHEYRLAVPARSKQELRDHLAAFRKEEELPPGAAFSQSPRLEPPRIVFMFSGQGTPYENMGRRLFEEEPAFRDMLQECDRILQGLAGWSLIEKLMTADVEAQLSAEVSQPTIFAFQVALAALWRSWGIEPAATIGQSLGEVAAAHVAGALDLADAMRIVYHRSRLLRSVVGLGRTAVIGVPPREAEEILQNIEGSIAVAGNTGPTSCIISGDGPAVEKVLVLLKQREVFCRLLEKLDAAAHSPQMDPLIAPLVEALAGIKPRPTTIPFISTVTAGVLDGQALTPQYWGRNLREPFRFWESAKYLIGDDHGLFLEMSYHPVLTGAVRQGFLHLEREGVALPSLQRDKEERETLLASLAAIYTQGYAVDWRRLFPGGGELVSLPAYRWHRERYWYDQLTGGKSPRSTVWAAAANAEEHPLLGEHLTSSLPSAQHYWETDFSATRLDYLSGHSVQGTILFPGSGYVEMALAAAKTLFGSDHVVVENLSFDRALMLSEEETCRLQVVASPTGSGGAEFQIASQSSGTNGATAWVLHAAGRLRRLRQGREMAPPEPARLAELQARCEAESSADEHYQAMRGRGLEYGPSFQAVRRLWSNFGEAVTRIEMPGAPQSETDPYRVHPVLLDAAFQSVAATLPPTEGDTYLPQSVRRVQVFGPVPSKLWCHVRLQAESQPGAATLEADLRLFADDGSVCVQVDGLRLKRLASAAPAREKAPRELVYEIAWRPQPRNQMIAAPPESRRGTWMLFADAFGVADALAALLATVEMDCLLVYTAAEYRMAEDRRRCWMRPGRVEDVERLLQEWPGDHPPFQAILHLWGMEGIEETQATASAIAREQALGCDTALAIVQALTRATDHNPPRLWIVTRAVQPVAGQMNPDGVGQAALWGFGRVVAREHSELWGGLIDLQSSAPDEQAPLLLAEVLASGNDEDQVAFRGYDRFVPRLVRPEPASAAPASSFRPDGAYLITGGLTGLGLETAYWMARGGARRLLLLSRTELPQRAAWNDLAADDPIRARVAAVRALEMMGVSVHTAAIDVGDEAQLGEFLRQYEADGLPPIRGIIHSAGLIQDQLLMRMDAATFAATLRPKLYATRLLYRLTAHLPLDFFVMFSSVSSVMGQFGQSNYAAGNAFMDAFAHFLRSLGRPALAINWGPWAEVGILARKGEAAPGSFPGVQAISPGQGLATLGYLLDQDTAQAIVLDADWPKVVASALVSELASAAAEMTAAPTAEETDALSLLELLLADRAERKAMIESYLRETIARTMRLDPARLNVNKPLTSLGMDSIMAVELKNKVESRLSLKLPLVDLFTASIARVADTLADQLEGDAKIGELLDEVERLPNEALDGAFTREESLDRSESADSQ
jgi:acyl transferase domain-containing protein/NAD(P)-dependent dehydrogenase (short-subunit alcohol dehydrogenase family)/acyl carrier protein